MPVGGGVRGLVQPPTPAQRHQVRTARRTARCALQPNDVPGLEVSLGKLLEHGLIQFGVCE
jgi:hypothetical protein